MKCTFQPTAQSSINLILKPTLHFNSQIEQDALHCTRTYIKLAFFLKTPMVLSYTKKRDTATSVNWILQTFGFLFLFLCSDALFRINHLNFHPVSTCYGDAEDSKPSRWTFPAREINSISLRIQISITKIPATTYIFLDWIQPRQLIKKE
jgi:hypothetical protein